MIASHILPAQTHWKVSTSSVTFKIKNLGFTVDGSFGGLIADIQFDAANSLNGSIEASTLSTGIDLRDKDLKQEKYFNASVYPQINLKSTSFSEENDGTFIGSFKLTMKGISKNVVIPFSYTEKDNTAIFKGSFSLNRRDYSVGGNSWTMSDDVTITLIINAIKQ
jgi:polyisoprenoid-binding protein YceI